MKAKLPGPIRRTHEYAQDQRRKGHIGKAVKVYMIAIGFSLAVILCLVAHAVSLVRLFVLSRRDFLISVYTPFILYWLWTHRPRNGVKGTN